MHPTMKAMTATRGTTISQASTVVLMTTFEFFTKRLYIVLKSTHTIHGKGFPWMLATAGFHLLTYNISGTTGACCSDVATHEACL